MTVLLGMYSPLHAITAGHEKLRKTLDFRLQFRQDELHGLGGQVPHYTPNSRKRKYSSLDVSKFPDHHGMYQLRAVIERPAFTWFSSRRKLLG